MGIGIYLNPLRDIQMEAPAAFCEKCRQEVYHGEARYQWEGRWLCPDCFRAAVSKALEEYPEQVAREMGLEVERYI